MKIWPGRINGMYFLFLKSLRYRWFEYILVGIVVAVVIALCIFIWSYLDSYERKIEVAIVIAVGGTAMTVFGMLICKTAFVGFMGAIIGYAAGAAIAITQDFSSAVSVIWSGSLLFMVCSGAVLFSVFATLPVSFLLIFREHVELLQE